MRIAVLITGEYREFEIAHKSWPFLKWPDVDFYLSTWSITKELNSRMKINISETVSIERVKEYINVVNWDISQPKTDYLTQQKMIDRWHAGLKLINDSGNTYDAVIIIRPDLYLDIDENILKEFLRTLKSNCIYCHTGGIKVTNSIQDQILFGTQDSVTRLNHIDHSEIFDWQINIHWFLAKQFIKLFDDIINIPFSKFSIVRSNCRDLSNISFDLVKKKAEEWYSAHHYVEEKLSVFSGFSNAVITLYKNNYGRFVRKTGDIQRNYDKMKLLSECGFSVPQILSKTDDSIDMEYIDGVDIQTYLLRNDINKLINFISETIDRFKSSFTQKDYSDIYRKNTEFVNNDPQLPFSAQELCGRLPKILPSGICHGDFTLENLIYAKSDNFVLIDVSTGDYDSWIFDIAKMRQDLEAKWFLRKTHIDLSAHLAIISEELKFRYPEAFDDNLYILMLLRVYKHCIPDTKEYELILTEIKRLWK